MAICIHGFHAENMYLVELILRLISNVILNKRSHIKPVPILLFMFWRVNFQVS